MKMMLVKMFAVTVVLIACSQASAVVPYSFDALSPGDLNGQDSWVNGTTSTSLQVSVGNGGRVVSTALAEPGDFPHFSRRYNDSNYSFGSFTGTETDSIIQADVRIDRLDGQSFFFGAVGDGGFLPMLGIRDPVGAPLRFELRRGSTGVSTWGSDPGLAAIAAGDWVQLRETINVAANTVSASYRNLTQGDVGFTPIAGLQGLQAFDAGATNLALIDSLWVRIEGDEGDKPTTMGDNLLVLVPEPASLLLLACGALLLARRRI